MRIYELNTVTISDENSSDPQNITFKSTSEVTDTTSVTEARNILESFPVGTTVVSMGNIVAGNYIWVKPTATCQLDIDGELITIKGGKETKMWVDFAAISVIVVTAANKVHLVIAGD